MTLHVSFPVLEISINYKMLFLNYDTPYFSTLATASRDQRVTNVASHQQM